MLKRMTHALSCAFIQTLAPFKAAVLPLSKKLNDKAQAVYHELC